MTVEERLRLAEMQRDWAEEYSRRLWDRQPRIAFFFASLGIMVGVAMSCLVHWVAW